MYKVDTQHGNGNTEQPHSPTSNGLPGVIFTVPVYICT